MQTVFYILIFLAMTAMFLFLPKKRETKRFGIIVMLVALVLEIAVFNYHSYHLWFRDYPQKELSLSNASVTGNTELLPDNSVKITGSATITYHSLDIPVGTVTLDLDWQTENEGNYVNAEFDFTDETPERMEYITDMFDKGAKLPEGTFTRGHYYRGVE